MTLLIVALISIPFNVSPPDVYRVHVQACHPYDSAGSSVLAWVRSVATNWDKAAAKQREIMRIPLVVERKVAYVIDERICRSALSEYNRYSGTRDATTGVESPASERVSVVRVGEVYIVTDPEKSFGEFTIYVTMDRDFRMLAHALG
jgi:hypothetical protein